MQVHVYLQWRRIRGVWDRTKDIERTSADAIGVLAEPSMGSPLEHDMLEHQRVEAEEVGKRKCFVSCEKKRRDGGLRCERKQHVGTEERCAAVVATSAGGFHGQNGGLGTHGSECTGHDHAEDTSGARGFRLIRDAGPSIMPGGCDLCGGEGSLKRGQNGSMYRRGARYEPDLAREIAYCHC